MQKSRGILFLTRKILLETVIRSSEKAIGLEMAARVIVVYKTR